MKVNTLPGVEIFEPKVFTDDRGYFMETFNDTRYPSSVGSRQANQSLSNKGVVRGLHYQDPAVSKLVWVAQGSIYDVAFDLKTGNWVGEILSSTNHKQMLTPEGFAHGFQALEDDTIVCYLMNGVYNPDGDYGINPMVVEWPLKKCILSDKDKNANKFSLQSGI